jgi:hypothetical protein
MRSDFHYLKCRHLLGLIRVMRGGVSANFKKRAEVRHALKILLHKHPKIRKASLSSLLCH